MVIHKLNMQRISSHLFSRNLIYGLILLSSIMSFILSPSVFANKCALDNDQSHAVSLYTAKKAEQAYIAYGNNHINKAIEILLETKTNHPFDRAFIAKMLGNLYAEQGDYQQALLYLTKALNANILNHTDKISSWRLLGDLQLQQQHYHKALLAYQQWLNYSCQQDPLIYKQIAFTYAQLKKWQQVVSYADKGLMLFSLNKQSNSNVESLTLMKLKLMALYNLKQYHEMTDLLKIMLPLSPQNKQLWLQLGQSYLLTENYANALTTFDLAYKNQLLTEAHDIIRLSQLLAKQLSPYQAAKLLNHAIDSADLIRNGDNILRLANYYYQAKEMQLAAQYFGEAAALNKDASLYLKQGRLLVINKQYQQAITAFNHALTQGIDAKSAVQLSLAMAYFELKNYKMAYRYAKLAAKDNNDASSKSAKNYLAYLQEKARSHQIQL